MEMNLLQFPTELGKYTVCNVSGMAWTHFKRIKIIIKTVFLNFSPDLHYDKIHHRFLVVEATDGEKVYDMFTVTRLYRSDNEVSPKNWLF